MLAAGVTNLPEEDLAQPRRRARSCSPRSWTSSRRGRALPLRAVTAFGEPEAVGRTALLQPRLGVEHETLAGPAAHPPGHLRGALPVRGPGGRARTSPVASRCSCFRYWEDWAVTASFDVARRYTNLGISVGFWR